ncbi:MAG: hypothetical protein WCL60_15560 [Methylococcales bacterium]
MQSYVISIPKGTLFCNATGSSKDTRKSNWIKYWKDYSGHRGSYDIKCCSAGCGNQAKYGGHVYFRSNEINLSRYLCIIPICKTCNDDKDCNYNKAGNNLWFVLRRNINALQLPYLGKRPTSADEWKELYGNLPHT